MRVELRPIGSVRTGAEVPPGTGASPMLRARWSWTRSTPKGSEKDHAFGGCAPLCPVGRLPRLRYETGRGLRARPEQRAGKVGGSLRNALGDVVRVTVGSASPGG